MSSALSKFRKALLQAFQHDVFNTAKAAAYSGMLMIFPALLVLTTLLAQVQDESVGRRDVVLHRLAHRFRADAVRRHRL